MNKKLPFEEVLGNRLKNLQVPDENASWQAMSRLLDKNDKPKAILPWKKYLVILLFLFLLLAGLWKLTVKNLPGKQLEKDKNSVVTASENSKNNSNLIKDKNGTINKSNITIADADSLNIPGSQQKAGDQKNTLVPVVSKKVQQVSQSNEHDEGKDIATENKRTASSKKITNQPVISSGNAPANNKQEHLITTTTVKKKEKSRTVKIKTGVKNREVVHAVTDREKNDLNNKAGKSKNKPVIADSLYNVNRTTLHTKGKTKMTVNGNSEADLVLQKDISIQQPVSTINEEADNAIAKLTPDPNAKSIDTQTEKRDTSFSLKNKEDSVRNNKQAIVTKTSLKQHKKQGHLSWSAGVGLQQQIPISKQEFSSYGFNGSKNIMNDYIPSVYLQLEKPSKWFVQVEFGYGRPQMTEALDYSRKTTLNNLSGKLSSNTMQLEKMFYHKLSLSFNYYIKPHLSIGAGVSNSWLYRVITEEQLKIKSMPGGQEEITKRIIHTSYTDSFFYKSVPALMLQANYQWRRLSFGFRYSGDIQPYIKFTKPSGEIDELKNQSLEILLKFKIWQSKK